MLVLTAAYDIVLAESARSGEMIDVALPDLEGVLPLTRSFAACLASATETSVAELPLPAADLAAAISSWRSWLAGRGVGLVPIADAASFHWPGYWIAVLGDKSLAAADEEMAVLMFGSPSGVVLSPQDHSLLGRAATDLPVRKGYALAGLDPTAGGRAAGRPRMRGKVEAVFVTAQATQPMREVEQARALAGRGLDGDRYARKAGTFTPRDGKGAGYDLTLIEAEAVEQLALPEGGRLHLMDTRRNLVTRGIDLNALVGRRFRIGDVECAGRRLCEPCAHLERLTTKGVLRQLIHRGGLRADVLSDGSITRGSVIETVD